ncbi:MAG: hypothetical protein GX166_04290 [Clostridiaceae bacterium]|nr:hypothetical protein [Clostridiaceae bacterium]
MCRRKVVLLFACLLVFGLGILITNADSSESKWVSLPYVAQGDEGNIDYLYAVGGYHSIDSGTDIWGTASYSEIRLVGDRMGDIVITYESGTVDKVPLIFGYTLWYYNNWKEYKGPFDGEAKNEKMANLLKEALHLNGAFEGHPPHVLQYTKTEVRRFYYEQSYRGTQKKIY